MSPSSIEIRTRRIFDAPRERLFEMFSDPRRLERWWGPKGFTNRFSTFEFRSGGSWVFVMIGPNGHEYPNESRFVEIQTPERIVLEHTVTPFYRNEMTFTDLGGRAELAWHAVFQVETPNEKFKEYLIEKNEENFDRLAAELERGEG